MENDNQGNGNQVNDNQTVLIDFVKTINYLLKNAESLDKMSIEDLRTIKKTLEVVKLYVKQLIVQQAMTNSSELREQIQQTKSMLEEKLAQLNEEYIEKIDTPLEADIPESIQKDRNAHNREEYSQLIALIEYVSNIIDNLDGNLQDVISSVFSEETQYDEKYREVVENIVKGLSHRNRETGELEIPETQYRSNIYSK